MSPVDSLALANKKNLVDRSKLESELHRISKEERTDMRLLNNAKQRFRSRYCKLDPVTDKTNEPSNVIMYETHNPGFCYRRNGECRMSTSPIKNTSLAFKDIYGLVFTDNDVDIDKILVLHLLGAHTTSTLTPPPKTQRTGFFQRDQSPLERLIERSKKKHVEDKMIKLLPVHVLDISRGTADDNIRDGRLAARVIINEKLNQLLRSVMAALETSNQDKLRELVEKSHNDEYLMEMICHPDMQEFIVSLNGFNVISCCESFYLTQPFKIVPQNLKVKTTTGYLECLVTQIRKNIFRLPITCCWEYGNNYFRLYHNPLESPRKTEEFDGKEMEIFSERLDVDNKREQGAKSKRIVESATTSSRSSSTTGRPRSGNSVVSSDSDMRSSRGSSPARTVNTETDPYQEPYRNPGNMSKMNLDKVADFLTKKANSAIQRDLRNLQITTMAEQVCMPGNDKASNTSNTESEVMKKYSLKQTLCPACSEKWKIPLPTPKTSVIKRTVLNQKQETSQPPNDSIHKLSTVIDRELKFWNEYTTKSSIANTNSMKFTPKRFYRSNIIEIIDLDELDLAKIRQMIKEHETKKKLSKFLNH